MYGSVAVRKDTRKIVVGTMRNHIDKKMPKRHHSHLGWYVQPTRTRTHIVDESRISVARSPKPLQYLTPETSVNLTTEILLTEDWYLAYLRRSLSPHT